MKFLLFSLIAIAVPVVISMLDRNTRRYYYLALAVVVAGGLLGFWGYQNSMVNSDNFHRQSVDILSVRAVNAGGALVFETGDGVFWLPGSYLDYEQKSILLSSDWKEDDATIWTSSPTDDWLTGLETRAFKVDPQVVATRESLQHTKYIKVGFGIVAFGALLMILNYLSIRVGGVRKSA